MPQHPLVTTVAEAQLLVSFSESTQIRSQLRVVQASQVFPSFIHQHKRYKEGAFGHIELVEASICETPAYDLESPFNHIKVMTAISSVVTLLRCFLKNVEEVSAFGHLSATGKRAGLNLFDIYVRSSLPWRCSNPADRQRDDEEWANRPAVCKLQRIPLAVLEGHHDVRCLFSPAMLISFQLLDLWFRGIECRLLPLYDLRKQWHYLGRPQAPRLFSQRMPFPHHHLSHHSPLLTHQEFYFNREKKPVACYGSIANYTNHFATSLDTESNNFEANLSQGLQNFMIVEAIVRSAKSRAPIKLKDLGDQIHHDDTQ